MKNLDTFDVLDRTPQDIPLRDAAATSLIGTIIIVAVSLTGATAAYVAVSGFQAPPATPSMGARALAGPCGGSLVQVLKAPTELRWNDIRVDFHGMQHWNASGLGVDARDASWHGSNVNGSRDMTSGDQIVIHYPPGSGTASVTFVHVPTKAVIYRTDLVEGLRDREEPQAGVSGLLAVERSPDGVNVTAADAGCAGVASVEVALQRASDSLYWNGAAFASATPVWLPAAGLNPSAGTGGIGYGRQDEGPSSWTFPFAGLDLQNNAAYNVLARATDRAGNTQTSGSAAAPTSFVNLDTEGSGIGYYTQDGSAVGAPDWEVLTDVPGLAANLSFVWLQSTPPGHAINENTPVFTASVRAEDGTLLWVAKIHDHFGSITVDAWDRHVGLDSSNRHYHVQNALTYGAYLNLWDEAWGLLQAVDEYGGNLTVWYQYGQYARGDWSARTTPDMPLPSGPGNSGGSGGAGNQGGAGGSGNGAESSNGAGAGGAGAGGSGNGGAGGGSNGGGAGGAGGSGHGG
ncbi:MAG TPA: hypothetical protein VNZ52_16395 [Candidatus Thermoplasmatota archaeon]|nr:hypothetical protein [Candidatus Thermoplasmatota archaeon]